MSLHFIDQWVIVLTLLVLFSRYTERTLQSIFFFVSRNENFSKLRANFEFDFGEFQRLSLIEIGRLLPDMRQKSWGEFLFTTSFNSFDYTSEGNTRFINSQSLTAC